ncbi:MAG TPA: hypothetical protein VHW05_07685 [Phenylobacterium sp.]|jgi:hypothetical protein|nr:hypothetical protein [Phenylobacterium sp.]
MKPYILAAACAAAAVNLCACSTLGGAPVASAGSADQLISSLTQFNVALASHCTGNTSFTWSPPLPPSGNIQLNCPLSSSALTPAAASAAPAPTPSAAASR